MPQWRSFPLSLFTGLARDRHPRVTRRSYNHRVYTRVWGLPPFALCLVSLHVSTAPPGRGCQQLPTMSCLSGPTPLISKHQMLLGIRCASAAQVNGRVTVVKLLGCCQRAFWPTCNCCTRLNECGHQEHARTADIQCYSAKCATAAATVWDTQSTVLHARRT